jgi:hypothetical protein
MQESPYLRSSGVWKKQESRQPFRFSQAHICGLEKRSGSHNIMLEPEPAGAHKNENRPALV